MTDLPFQWNLHLTNETKTRFFCLLNDQLKVWTPVPKSADSTLLGMRVRANMHKHYSVTWFPKQHHRHRWDHFHNPPSMNYHTQLFWSRSYKWHEIPHLCSTEAPNLCCNQTTANPTITLSVPTRTEQCCEHLKISCEDSKLYNETKLFVTWGFISVHWRVFI